MGGPRFCISLYAGFLALQAYTASVAPLEQVTDLITKLKAQVEQEGKEEASSYDAFACHCKTKTDSLSSAILGMRDLIDVKAADIEEKSTQKDAKAKELQSTKASKERAHGELEDKNAECAKSKAENEAKASDNSKAISSLQNAIHYVANAKSEEKQSALLSMRRQTRAKQQQEADAMKVLEEGLSSFQAGGLALLQERARMDPSDPMYKYHSQGLVDTMTQILEKATQRKEELAEEYSKVERGCRDSSAAISQKISNAAGTIDTLSTDVDTLGGEIGGARKDTVEANVALKDSQLFLQDLTSVCEQRAADWDQRSKLRAEELAQFGSALEILGGVDAGAAKEARVASFLQQRRSKATLLRGRRPRSPAAATDLGQESQRHSEDKEEGPPQAARIRDALALLQREGERLGSTALAALVVRSSSRGDPFDKVKDLLQKLTERLLHEARQETTKKGFCDTEVGKAKQDRDYRMEQVRKLDVELAQLNLRKEELDFDTARLTEALSKIRADLEDAGELRAKERGDNMEAIRSAKEGLQAVAKAALTLKTFYQKSARAEVLLLQKQTRASPIEEDEGSSPGFKGAYQGKQTAATGILGILEVIQSDFERSVEQTEVAEKDALAKFTEYEQAGKADAAALEAKKALEEEEARSTSAALAAASTSLRDNMMLVDTALRSLEKLKTMCVDSGMSFEERSQKRDDEVEALRRALCILDVDGAEPSCWNGAEPNWESI